MGCQTYVRAMRQLESPTSSECNAKFSPDGQWLAYQSDASGRREVYVPDGRFVMIRHSDPKDPTIGREIIVVQNWFEELKRPAAAK